MAENKDDGASAFDSAMQARTPGRDIFGPLDDHLPEIRIPADVKVDAMRAAAAMGLDISTWQRELVYASLYGPEHLASLYQERARRVLGNAGRTDSTQPGTPLPAFLRGASK